MPRSTLLTVALRRQLILNGHKSRSQPGFDPIPVVKLFTPDASATWLLTELNPDNPDLAFGLCDLGLGSPELGYVSLSEIASIRGRLGLPVERDRFFCPDRAAVCSSPAHLGKGSAFNVLSYFLAQAAL